MPALANPGYEIVAQELAKGSSQCAAVMSIGLSRNAGHRVCNRPEVKARAREINPAMDVYDPASGVKRRPGRPRGWHPRRLPNQNDIIVQLMDMATTCRAAGNWREANIALKRASELIAARERLAPKPEPTKKQKWQRRLNAREPDEETQDEPAADDAGSPDISEIADVVGRLNDGPGDLTQEEAARSVADGPEGSVSEADGH